MEDNVKLILGEALQQLRKLPDGYADLLLTDPPYGINITKNNYIGTVRKNSPTFKKADWDKTRPSRALFEEMQRVSKNQVIWGGNYFLDCLPPSRCFLVWYKCDRLPTLTFADCELAWTSYNKNAMVFNCRWRGGVRDSKEPKVGHPTQKALEVMKWCLNMFSKPGDMILDPFMGSGTTAVACAAMNRDFMGVELDPDYLDIAKQRIAQS